MTQPLFSLNRISLNGVGSPQSTQQQQEIMQLVQLMHQNPQLANLLHQNPQIVQQIESNPQLLQQLVGHMQQGNQTQLPQFNSNAPAQQAMQAAGLNVSPAQAMSNAGMLNAKQTMQSALSNNPVSGTAPGIYNTPTTSGPSDPRNYSGTHNPQVNSFVHQQQANQQGTLQQQINEYINGDSTKQILRDLTGALEEQSTTDSESSDNTSGGVRG